MTIDSIAKEEYHLCISDCDYLIDKTIWVATLSNGIVVYQDDEKSGKDEVVAWKRLYDYCAKEQTDIISMYLKFRSNIKQMPSGEDVDGYYFSYGAHREFDEEITRMHYVCGTCHNGRIESTWYTTPELTKTRTDSRKLSEKDVSQKRLILKQEYRD